MTSVHFDPVSRGPRTARFTHGFTQWFAQRCSWNRAHWIGVIALGGLLWLTAYYYRYAAFLPELGDRQVPDGFIWLPMMAILWPIGLGLTNLMLGSIRSGSLSFPLVSALMGPLGFGWTHLRMVGYVDYRRWSDWLALMRAHGGELLVQALYGSAVLLLAYAAVAFSGYAIGRYGLRKLFLAPSPTSASGRMLAWARRDAVRFGCWLTLAVTYGLILTFALVRGQWAMAGALMINFAVPPVLLVTCGAYATRDAALPAARHRARRSADVRLDDDADRPTTNRMMVCRNTAPDGRRSGVAAKRTAAGGNGRTAGRAVALDGGWQHDERVDWLRLLFFPAIGALIGAVAVFILVAPYQDECPINGVCTPIGDNWFIDWTNLVDMVPQFLVLYLVAGYLGYVAVLTARLIARALRNARSARNRTASRGKEQS
ncbi:hypothetical protein JS533_010485 [Bifidobacterium amazonense]|uniref:ABC transporter permease n=1 Tax=Bifidobacterium amazonense TaxID=2809027 RepID=A0ABS9VX78_9BIFI|nr:hypothetical protein [Bifidobacterium amazonense]MCH9276692.1 hypothetical protein [Bifidobacterium amazonense]